MPVATPYGQMEIGSHELTIDGNVWIVDVSAAGCTARLRDQPPVQFVAPFDFRLLFTQSERLAIYGSSDGVVREFLGALQTMIGPVDLQDQQTQQGVGYLAMIGLIAPERVEQVLSGVAP